MVMIGQLGITEEDIKKRLKIESFNDLDLARASTLIDNLIKLSETKSV
jgi:hypothetical protein